MKNADEPRTRASLLHRLRDSKDNDAWREFVRTYGPVVHDWCRGFGLQEQDAQDVTQNVLTRMFRALGTFVYDPNQRFRGFLRTATRNTWQSFISTGQYAERAQGGSDVLQALQQLPAREDLCQKVEEQFDREMFDEACRQVRAWVRTPETWEVFRLRAFDELDCSAIAAKLGMKIDRVYEAYSRVLTKFKQVLKELEQAEDAP